MSDFGLKEFGLQIPSYEDWRDLYFDSAKQTFGTDLNVGTSSIAGQLLALFAYQDMVIWEGLQGVYDSQTYDGAEGIYLDEILSRRGVFRKSAAAGTGYAFVQTTSAASWTYQVSTATYISATNGQNYQVTTATSLRDRIAAFKMTKAELQSLIPPVIFTISNVQSGVDKTLTVNTSSATALTDLATFISQNIAPTETSKVFVNGNTLYVGFLANDLTTPVGLNNTVRFFANSNVGTKWSLLPVKGTVTGVYPVYSGEVNSITPTPSSGFVSVGNFTEFYEGQEVETDAEYRVRFNDTVDEANAATRPAIYKAISDIDGVERVRIYDNPTSRDTPEAPAFTFNTVVLGGTTEAIATTLYNKKPINTLTSGTTSYTITLPDGGNEVIRYTPAGEQSYTLKISYRTVDDRPLTDEEMKQIINNLVVLTASFNIGTKVFNVQLQGVVFSSVTYGRLSYLKVETKPTGSDDSQYSTADISSSFADIPSINAEDITFEQVT